MLLTRNSQMMAGFGPTSVHCTPAVSSEECSCLILMVIVGYEICIMRLTHFKH